MGGVWTVRRWLFPVRFRLWLPGAASERTLEGQQRRHVPPAAAGASPGLHLGDAELGRELR